MQVGIAISSLLQLRVLRLGLIRDGNLRVAFVPKGEKGLLSTDEVESERARRPVRAKQFRDGRGFSGIPGNRGEE